MLSNEEIKDVKSSVENFCENLVDSVCVESVKESNENINKLSFDKDKLKNGVDMREYIRSYKEWNIVKGDNGEELESIINEEIEKYKNDYIIKSREEIVKKYGVSEDFILLDLNESISYNLDKICNNENYEDYVIFCDGKYMLINNDSFGVLYDVKGYDNEYDYDLFMFVEYLREYVLGSELKD